MNFWGKNDIAANMLHIGKEWTVKMNYKMVSLLEHYFPCHMFTKHLSEMSTIIYF
jgi:hypothetical protein